MLPRFKKKNADFTSLRTYVDRSTAQADQKRLTHEGIRAEITQTDGRRIPAKGNYGVAIHLRVPRQDLTRALQTLERKKSLPEVSGSDSITPQTATPGAPDTTADASRQPHELSKRIDRAYKTALIGFLLVPVVLNLYSLWLQKDVLPQWQVLSGPEKAKTGATFLLNVFTLAFVAFFVLSPWQRAVPV